MSNQNAMIQIIEGLNTDLAWEYAASIQYAQHASMLDGAEYYAIVEELEEHAREEFKHAITLNDIIVYLGGIPTVCVENILISQDNKEMLRQDLQGEYDAIKRYIMRIQQLESIGLYDTAQKIRNIIVEEQEHAIDLETALGIKKSIPKF